MHDRPDDDVFQCAFTLDRIGVQVGADDTAVGRRMQMICAAFGLQPALRPLSEKRLILQWRAHDDGVTIPASATPVVEQQELTFFQDDLQLYLSDGASIVHIDRQAGVARGSVRAAGGRSVSHFRQDLFLYSLLFLLRYRDLYGLHGAGVVRDGVGYLLVAASDGGKSTLAFSLVRQGWSYLSDDSLLLSRQSDGVAAHALRRDFCLDAEAVRYFPDIAAHWEPCPLTDGAKQRLDMSTCYAAQRLAACMAARPHLSRNYRRGAQPAHAGRANRSLFAASRSEPMRPV